MKFKVLQTIADVLGAAVVVLIITDLALYLSALV